ncbi:MAG: pyridoxamine 5'-phosphate oxidase family protein [Candidatus Abyssobacteria bacterium SURF_17]|uniref:Pyridoxamine 5'-phosphate oxidase family protein n=1 Tax=Candidatus Abyssobacteria bacterium SURF_17 TaxID=2093361 RepID=A0A419EXG6_9BACT|nr:MAG: pyridoxamine 5'-phosphate oxidase family protein [Candidatus Abyssubacteria bacterium SURF_17]
MKAWIEDRAEMEKILERAAVGRLGLVTDEGPYIVPLNFAYRDGCIYVHTGIEGRKLEEIQKNPYVCFEVDELLEIVPNEQPCLFTTYYRSVITWGMARLVEDDAEKMKGLELLLKKYASNTKHEPVPEHALAIVNVCEIRVEKMTGKANLPEGGPG